MNYDDLINRIVNHPDYALDHILYEAIESRDLELAKKISDKGVKCKETDILFELIETADLELFKQYSEFFGDLKYCAIQHACTVGKLDIALYLLTNRPGLNYGIYGAVAGNNVELTKTLLSFSDFGVNDLLYSIAAYNEELIEASPLVIEYLLDVGAEPGYAYSGVKDKESKFAIAMKSLGCGDVAEAKNIFNF